jgi:hypothetical protein
MTYAAFGLVQAQDFNTLVGGNPTTTANTLNAVWATGGSAAGYGQTAVANVAVGNTVTNTEWAALVNNTASAASHQGSSITSVTAPVSGGTITYLSAIPTNLSTIYTNRLNAASQGSTTSNSIAYGSTWSAGLTFTHTATFANGDAARYFFNSGGQLAMTVSHANTAAGINILFNQLCSNVGTVVMSAPTSGSITVSGTSYNGITKVGGGGTTPTIDAPKGYYSLTTSNATVFTQTASTGPSGYLGTFIRFIVKSNGTQGSNSDAGSVITIYTVWDEIPDGYLVGTGSTTTMTLRPPSTTNIANTWGAVTLAGSVTGS